MKHTQKSYFNKDIWKNYFQSVENNVGTKYSVPTSHIVHYIVPFALTLLVAQVSQSSALRCARTQRKLRELLLCLSLIWLFMIDCSCQRRWLRFLCVISWCPQSHWCHSGSTGCSLACFLFQLQLDLRATRQHTDSMRQKLHTPNVNMSSYEDHERQ